MLLLTEFALPWELRRFCFDMTPCLRMRPLGESYISLPRQGTALLQFVFPIELVLTMYFYIV